MLRRRLVKNRLSFQVNLPKDLVRNLGWQKGDGLFIKPRGRQGLYIERLLGQPLPPRKKKGSPVI